MSSKKELAEDLAGSLVAIFVGYIIFIVIIINIPGTKEIDGTLIANVFTGGVTLFAPIAAYYLLNNWKEQHNKTILSHEAKELWHKFKSLEKKTYALEEIYLNSGQVQLLAYFKSIPDLNKATFDLINAYDKSYPEFNYFTELAKDKKNNLHQNYYGAIKTYREYIENIKRDTTIGEIYETEEELRTNLIDENQKIRDYLSNFILIK